MVERWFTSPPTLPPVRGPFMSRILVLLVILSLTGPTLGDEVETWLKKHGLSEYLDELVELGAESKEDLSFIEPSGVCSAFVSAYCVVCVGVDTFPYRPCYNRIRCVMLWNTHGMWRLLCGV